MKEYSIMEQFALVALNAQDSNHSTQAKHVAVCGIEAAKIIEQLLMEEKEKEITEFERLLKRQLSQIKKLSAKERKNIERTITNRLKTEGVLYTVPNLLGCDMYYYTANITIREYKCDEELYRRITEGLKAVILEPGEVTIETVILLWLFRECGCFHDIFSIEEQDQIGRRFMQLSAENGLYRTIWEQEFHSSARGAYLSFLNHKRRLFMNPYLEGINLLFPFFDRRQSIFIDMVILGTTVAERRQKTIEFLRENGHTCEELLFGTETIVKIDNGYYRIWPATRYAKLPIQGIELLPVYK